jgi:circadian clock protein KaiC
MTSADAILPTGIPGLDTVLGGGVTHPALAVIIGTPGAGKTILASQIIFHAARLGLQTIVFTAFSEGITQYLQHMRSLAFFDEAAVNDTVQFLTLAGVATNEDSSPTAAIARTIRTSGAKVVLLDGFQGAEALGVSDQRVRMVLSALATQIRYLDATILVTLAGSVRDPQLHAEMTVADIAIGLDYTVQGRRHQRLVEVVKLRGRAQWAGLHSYRIDSTGIQVFPRIEGYPVPEPPPNTVARAPFQLPELDQLMGGGPNVGTTTLLAGAPGVGKTTLGLYWALAEAQPDATTLFLTFTEHLDQLQQKATAFGLDLSGAISQNRVRVVRVSSVDLNPDQVAQILLTELSVGHVRRLVIDDSIVLLHELGARTRDYLSALNEIVYSAQITSLYLLEIAPFEGLRVNVMNTPLATLGDNIVVIQQYEITGRLHRLLAVLRMRLSFFDRTLRELILDETGIRLLSPEATEAGLLTTGAQLSGGVAPEPTTQDDAAAPQA